MLLSTILVTIVMANVTYFFTIQELHRKRSTVESQIERLAKNIATLQLLDRQDWSVYQGYISQLMAINKDIVYIAVYDDFNTLRAHTFNRDLVDVRHAVNSPRMEADIVRRLDRGAISEENRNDLRTEKVNIQVGDRVLGSVHVGFSLIEINRDLRNGFLLNLGLALFFMAVFTAASIFISTKLTRPLEKLSTAMNAVTEGDLNQKIRIDTHDEISQLAHAFNEMVDVLRERKIIDKMGFELGSTFEIENLVTLVRQRLCGAIGAQSVRLFIRKRGISNTFLEFGESTVDKYNSTGNFTLPPDLITDLEKQENGLRSGDAAENLSAVLDDAGLLSDDLVVPMKVKDRLFGLLFFNLAAGETNLTTKMRHFVTTLAGQVGLALENALLYDELRDQDRIKHELFIAREVQKKLLPSAMPDIQGFNIEAVCKPAHEVGGDYFDFFRVNDHQWGIVIADVSGKGTSASFYMAEIKGMMLSLVTLYQSPRDLLIQLNQKLYSSVERRVFATIIYGILDTRTRRFKLARAGHNPLLKISQNRKCQFITPAGIGLGLESGELFEAKLEEITISLNPTELLLLYTDGVTDAMDSRQQMFGEERLLQAVRSSVHNNPAALRTHILESIERFTEETEPTDDITMVAIQAT